MMMKIAMTIPTTCHFLLLLATIFTTLFTTVSVQGVEFEAPNWIIPRDLQPYPTMSVSVGDSITFSWDTGIHDVWVYPSGTCADEQGKYMIASRQDNPTTYTFTNQDGNVGEMTFVCDINQHCEQGMIMDVIVLGGGVDTSAPTDPYVDTYTPTLPLVATDPPTLPVDPAGTTPEVPDTDPSDALEEGALETATTNPAVPPLFDTCYVCGNEENIMTNLEQIVQLPGGIGSPPGSVFPVSCSDLYTDGLNGDIPTDSCPRITQLSFTPCGCMPPNFTCNICSVDDDDNTFGFRITTPDNTVTLPTTTIASGPTVCSDLSEAGLQGELTPAECQAAAVFAFTPCGCAHANFTCSVCGFPDFTVQSPDVPSPVGLAGGAGTCGDLELLGSTGQLSPQQCTDAADAIIFADNSCGCASANFTCSVCGRGLSVQNPDVTLTIPTLIAGVAGGGSGQSGTCGELETLGETGQLSPQQCTAAADAIIYADNSCGCGVPPEDLPDLPTCNICQSSFGFGGVNDTTTQPLTPNNTLPLSATDQTSTCGELYDLGLNNGLGFARCRAAQVQAVQRCNCAPIDYTCSVCGTGLYFDPVSGEELQMTMNNPDANFTNPATGMDLNCGVLEAAGLEGVITPNDCGYLTTLVQINCGCAPLGFTCNICDDNSRYGTTDADAESVVNSVTLPDNAFVPGESITCGAAQVAGLAGELDPATCTVYSSLARLPTTCACQAETASAADTDATDSDTTTTTNENKDDGTAAPTSTTVMTTDPPTTAVVIPTTTAAPVAVAVAVETSAADAAAEDEKVTTPVLVTTPPPVGTVTPNTATTTITDVPVVAPVPVEGEEDLTNSTATNDEGKEPAFVFDDVPAPAPDDTPPTTTLTTGAQAPIATSTAITFDPAPEGEETPVNEATTSSGTANSMEGAESANSSSSTISCRSSIAVVGTLGVFVLVATSTTTLF